jgi:hypothetical protein
MATDPFDSLRVRLTNTVTRRGSLGVLGLLGMTNIPLPDAAMAKKKRKKKKDKKKGNKKGQTTMPVPTTTGTTTRAPGTCGAAGSNCGTAQTACICGASPTDLENVRCVSLEDLVLDPCEQDTDCTGGKICILDPVGQTTAICVAPCTL